MDSRVISVTELNNTAKELIEQFSLFKNLYIKGEIADFKGASKNGHIYFTLKDEVCSVRAVIWKGNITKAVRNLKNGSEVLIAGKISLYNKGGYINITVYDVIEKGAGDLALKKDEIYKKYENLGYFKDENKKVLPKYPEKIAVITSKRGAAIGDVLRTINMRYSNCTVTVIDVAVQGEEAPKQIAKAVLETDNKYDLIFITRGGGSEEDLSAYDSAEVLEAVFRCETPVLCAVGHDRDISLLDLVCDKSASTPTQGAVLAVPDSKSVLADLEKVSQGLLKAVQSIYTEKHKDYIICTKHKGLTGFKQQIQSRLDDINKRKLKLDEQIKNRLREDEFKLILSAERIESLSPLSVLTRGYSIALKDNKPIIDAKHLKNADNVYIKLLKGGFTAKVSEVDYE